MINLVEGSNQVKMMAGGYWIPVNITKNGGMLTFRFKYNKSLINEIKGLEQRKFDGNTKLWSAPITKRNEFTLKYLLGEDPYTDYDGEIVSIPVTRPLRAHQRVMLDFSVARKRLILAADMGTGKSLVMIEFAEYMWANHRPKSCNLPPFEGVWYVGPKSALVSFKRELMKWQAKFLPQLFTCEGFVKHVATISQSGKGMPPLILLLDESSRYKTPNSQRSKAAKHVADSMIDHWNKGYIIEATGTPSPKDPTDWWHQVEIACPGYLKESSQFQLRQSLGIVEERESQYGAKYPHLVAWLDNEDKCAKCGRFKADPNHNPADIAMGVESAHAWVKSENRITKMFSRLNGIVKVVKKADCLDLPEKQYEEIRITPDIEILKAARIIKTVSVRAVEALTLLRELSDGFQYEEIKTGDYEDCKHCGGSGKIREHVPDAPHSEDDYTINLNMQYTVESVDCPDCHGTGKKVVVIRNAAEIKSQKDEVFIDELEANEEHGRYVVWGGFTATIDRLVKIALSKDWAVLRVDGRGYHPFLTDKMPQADYSTLLDCMDLSNPRFEELRVKFPRVCFVGHPKAGGMGLTLTGSNTALFYSNDFSGEARMQAEDRIHRLGMDANRGATIKDIIMLPSDKLVLDNLKKKKNLQGMTMGELIDATDDRLIKV